MKLPRRLLLALACASVAFSVQAADYPEKPIRLIVPYPPGGTTDLLARAIAPRLGERLHQTVIIDNRAGAGGVIGAQAVARSAPDGYTLVFASIATHGILPVLQKPAPYDAIKDFSPITLVATTPNVLVANVQQPIKSVAELLAAARAKPGTINFGSTSLGGSPHMSGELLRSMTGIDIVHVPYKGGGPMLIDLMGGQIQVAFDNLPSSIAHIRAGKIRALALTTAKRWPGAPDIPTMAEAGVPGYESGAWFGMLAPANTPKPIVDMLQKHVAAILALPEVEKMFLEQGAEPVGDTPEQFAKVIASEMQKWAKVAAATGVKLD
ncbi:tripartite tricarboxylate transporter substrate binding protein [soil metagenome]